MKKFLDKLHTPHWLFLLLAIVLVLRIPSFFEPYSYGDEMIYLTLGEAIRQRVPLYSQIHDNKPPLLYIAAALAGSLFWFKAILAFWHLITIYLFWKLSEVLFPGKLRLHKVAVWIFAILTTIPLLEGNIANAENFMLGFTISGFLILFSKKIIPKNLIIAGILFSLAALFKLPAAFDVTAIIFLWLTQNKFSSKNLKLILTRSVYLGIGFLLPISITFIWYYFRDALSQYLTAAFLQNVGYLSSWRPSDVQEPFLTRNAPLLYRGGVALLAMLILYIKRKKLSKEFIFATTWLVFALFAVTLSERPYPHYLLQTVPPLSLLLAILFTQKSIEQTLAIIPLSLAFFVPLYYKFWYYPTVSYYIRFVKFTTGNISKEDYLTSFGSNVLRNYKIAKYLTSSSRRNSKVFIWGDGTAIYALSRRLPPIKYVADYHIRDFSDNNEVLDLLDKSKPEFIVVLPDAPEFPELSIFLRENYAQTTDVPEADVWRSLDK